MTILPKNRWSGATAVVLLAYGVVSLHFSATHSPPYDDWRHYSSAVYSLHTGDLRPYAVNPPLLRISAALPTVLLGQNNVVAVDPQPTHDRPEKRVYSAFMRSYGDVFESQIKQAKLVSVAWSMLGCWGCFLLAGRVAGSRSDRRSVRRSALRKNGLCGDDESELQMANWSFQISNLHGSVRRLKRFPLASGRSSRSWEKMARRDGVDFDRRAGFFAASAWAISPMMIGHAASLAPDVIAATGVVWATLAIGHWMRRRDVGSAAIAGLVMGLAVCTKFSLAVMVPVWAVACVAWGLRRMPFAGLAGSFAVALLAGWFTVQTVYGWHQPAFQLGRPSFASKLMAGELLETDDGVVRTPDPQYGNRFRGTPLASWWIPLPRVLVEGMDRQKADFDAAGWWAFQNGTWSTEGRWDYYGFAWLIKTPLGHIVLTGIGIVVWIDSGVRSNLRKCSSDDAMLATLVASAAVSIVVVSAHTKMNEHYRYLIPCLPATFVLMGFAFGRARSNTGRYTMFGLLAAGLVSVAFQYPNMISYFNESVGGGRGGYRYLLGSSVDWGQDLPRLRQWRAQREASGDTDLPIHFALFVPPMQEDVLRLPADSVDFAWISWRETWARVPFQKTLSPGLYVVSVSHLMFPLSPYSVFQDFEPVERIGNTHFVFVLEETIDAP